jgi:biofilm PGA synthesis N-glycosyltransferase PgaC
MKNLAVYIVLYIISFGLIASVFVRHNETPIHIYWIQNVIVFAAFLFLTKYLVYMVVSPWHDARWAVWRAKNKNKITAYHPKVSVLVPAWNEEVGIMSTIESLLKNSYDNIEIVVINDGSTDNSDTLIKDFIRKYEVNSTAGKSIVYHYQENGGKGTALNKGIELSTGEMVVSIDADSIAERDAIKNFVERFADPKVMAAVGNVKIGNTASIIATVQYLEFLFSFYFKRAESLLGSIYIIGGAAGAFRRELFEKLGVYNVNNITEDIELSMRIQSAGMKIVYVADAVIYTEGANDISGLMKQRLRWKRGRLDTFIKYKGLFFSRRNEHNRFLSWFVLPFAALGDAELLFEIPFIIFLYVTSFYTHDYSAFLSALLVVTFVFIVQIFTPDKKYNTSNGYALAPIGWLMFYLVTIIELNAFIKSLHSMYRKKPIVWQSWKRTGLVEKD